MAVQGSYSIVVDGEHFEVSVSDLGRQGDQRRFRVLVGDREHEVGVVQEAQARGTPRLDLGNVEKIDAPSKKKAPAAAAGPESGTVVGAPMTGKIVSVQVSEGQTVAEGDLLVVLEAMKMENSILATSAGVVSGIAVSAGQNIRKGEKICLLRAS